MVSPEPKNSAPLQSLTLDELRSILSDEIHRIRDGQTTAATVNAISNATGKILSSVKLQMEYYRLTGQKVEIPLLAGTTPKE
jgi:hypothetical protein